MCCSPQYSKGMNLLQLALPLLGLLLSGARSPAAEPSVPNITIDAMVVALPKDRALQFTTNHNLIAAPSEGLQAIAQLVQQKQAASVANAALTTLPGKRVTSDSGSTTLEAESIVSDAGEIETSLELKCGSAKLSTSFSAPDNGVKFLGAFDSTDKTQDATCFAFVRVRADAPLTWTVNGIVVTHGDPFLVKAAQALADLPQPVTVPDLIQAFTEESNEWMQRARQVQATGPDDPDRSRWRISAAEDHRIGDLARVLAASRDPRAAVALGNVLDTPNFPFYGRSGAYRGLFDYFVHDLGYGLPPEQRDKIPEEFTNVLPWEDAAARRWWMANKANCQAAAAKRSTQVP